jgi:hypothetical protein
LFRIDAFDVLLPDFTARRHLAVPRIDVLSANWRQTSEQKTSNTEVKMSGRDAEHLSE